MGAVFIKHMPEMKEIYKVYCRNHDDSLTLLENLDEDAELQDAIQESLVTVKYVSRQLACF